MPISVTKTGKIRLPRLSNPQLKNIGEVMVIAQKKRWASATNANGNPATKLSVKYFFEKRKLRGGRPVRDMKMTGVTVANFSLRKAGQDQIRAENTSRAGRDHARRANQYEQMIGFAASDQLAVFDEAKFQFGDYLQSAWIVLRK